MKKEIKKNKKLTMEELIKSEQFPPVAPYVKEKFKNKSNKFNIPNNNSELSELDNLKKLEKLFIKYNYFNSNNNKELENDTDIMADLLNSSLIQVINYINKNSGYNTKWIKQLFNTYEGTVGKKTDYDLNDKMLFAHFMEIMKLNKISKRQAIMLLRHFFKISESGAKRIWDIYKDNKADYPYTWQNRYLTQMWILCVIMGTSPILTLNYHGIKSETKEQFKKMISETINFFRDKLKDKKLKKDHLDFFEDKENELIINYINQEFRTPLDFLSNLTNNKSISEINKFNEEYRQRIIKSENNLKDTLYESGYNTENIDKGIGANDPVIKELYEFRDKETKSYEQYYNANSKHLLEYRKFRYQLVNLIGRIDQNLFPDKY